jgi:bile acid:Na+ symporter, BASS family
MKIYQLIERHFWVFLAGGVLVGLWYPAYSNLLMPLLKPILMIMLFFVFLKTDFLHILDTIKDYKLMGYIVCLKMIIVPVLFFLSVNIINPGLAIGVLLLTAMPAGAATPTLTDIVKGNIPLSMSIVILTSLIAPFTVPLLFWLIKINILSISPLAIFFDMVLFVFLPMIASQVVKRYFPLGISKGEHLFTSVNIVLLFVLIYTAMGSQRDVIINNTGSLVLKILFLYLVFILLHLIGYLTGYKQNKESKVALAISSAYMNNGMAIVLAATHFEPSILILMILSEIPWSTMLAPFKRIIKYL